MDGEALAWEGDEAEPPDGELPQAAEQRATESPDTAPPSADDRVCEATPEYRSGPAASTSKTRAA